jgi:hypothetical protein
MDILKGDTGFKSSYINALTRIISVKRMVETKIFTAGIQYVKKNGCFFKNSKFLIQRRLE